MKTTELPTDEDLAEILREDCAGFLQTLSDCYAGKIMAYLGKVSWNALDEHELADTFQETLRDVWQRIRQADFNPDRPLRMVFRIARNKGVDARRRKLGRRQFSETDIADLVIADMEGDGTGAGGQASVSRGTAAIPRDTTETAGGFAHSPTGGGDRVC